MKKALLKLLNENPRLTDAELAVMLNIPEKDVTAEISRLEAEGIIGGYRAIVDWSRVDDCHEVTALIELRVSPRRDTGFDEIAAEILEFPEVETVHLMSGAYDFAVYVKAATMQEIAMFVARRLSTLDSVLSTATHFVLKSYKENGVMLAGPDEDERRPITF